MPVKSDPFKTGIDGLDKLIPTGIPRGSSILVEGGPGCGKTLLCLQMAMSACRRSEKVLFMSFEEPETKLREHMREFGWDVDEFEKSGLFRLKRFNALDIARSVEALLSGAKKELLIDVHPMLFPKDFKPDVVFIDSLTSISTAFSGEESQLPF
ncbi:MAG: AAA family ATPase [Candidatus Aenigmarchaeota archaeon]|nr:AAA family ATPase [Candidatus Aenigmarchaeota archaeon]